MGASVTDPDVTDLPERNEVAVGDIADSWRSVFKEMVVASASPDLLRQVIREFAQQMMAVDVEIRCNARYGYRVETAGLVSR